ILSRYEPTGANVACLSLRRIASMTAVTERVFLFRVGVNDYYLNETASSCAGATSPGVRLEYRTTETQLCASDIVAIVDNSSGITGGSCVLGEFEKLRKKAAKEGAAS
ncbi:MAG TPA: hypothetical protein VNH64_02810, partial [Parvularculaceae bacterium]|nr:hypothetical protein [Parvularculaceae bacterium]